MSRWYLSSGGFVRGVFFFRGFLSGGCLSAGGICLPGVIDAGCFCPRVFFFVPESSRHINSNLVPSVAPYLTSLLSRHISEDLNIFLLN